MDKKNTRGMRLIIAGIAMLFVFFIMVRIFLDESKNFSLPLINNTTMFMVLWVVIILFTLTFLFILVRNLIKLYYARAPYKGGRFKKRLVFFFISFSIIPTMLLFFFATDLITNSIDKWFKADIESIVTKFEDLNKSYYEKAKDDLKHFAYLIADDIKYFQLINKENRPFLHNKTREMMIKFNLDVVNIYVNRQEEVSLLSPSISLREYKDLPTKFIFSELGGSDPIQTDPMKKGMLIRNGVNFETKDGDKVQVIIGMFFPEKYIETLNTLSGMVQKYTQLKTIKDPVKTTYVLLFIFITILVVFSASWVGLYLARGITGPIEKLVAAASEVSKGNLETQINYEAQDEFNILIKEFNRMVSDLKENRDKLNKRTIQLKQRRSITETIMKHITTGVIAINSRGEIIDINREAANMLAMKMEKIDRKHYSEIIPGDIYQGLRLMIEKAYTTHFKIIENELDVKVRGKVMILGVKITQLRNPINNKFFGILVVLTDLTELIKAQRMMVWREVAKRIAHEIKNPLTPITISSQRILKALELPDDRFRKIVEDSLNIISQEIESIKKLAEEFANFARLPEMKFTKGDINEVIEKLISVYSSIYSHMDFKVSLDVEIPMAKMDVEQMKRIFVNLIDNAVEAAGEKGTIEFVTKYNPESQFIRIEIADDGPGISDEDKQKLFIPYFSNKSTGTGLGLAIAHSIIEEHKGIVSVEDNQPKGSRFIIEIPS